MPYQAISFFNDLPNNKFLTLSNSILKEMSKSSPKEKKTLREKEKLLIMSDFSISVCVFKRLVLQTCRTGLFEKGLIYSKDKTNLH